jgi:hypothetical protein
MERIRVPADKIRLSLDVIFQRIVTHGPSRQDGPFHLERAMNSCNVTTTVLLLLCLTGCFAKYAATDVSRQTHVFGIELNSGIDYQEIGGVKATEEPCLKGYERSFDQLDVTIGYGFDKKIRKITTRNSSTNVFGISPGVSLEEGRRLAQHASLSEVSQYHYQGKGVTLTLLVDGHNKVFGITVETED